MKKVKCRICGVNFNVNPVTGSNIDSGFKAVFYNNIFVEAKCPFGHVNEVSLEGTYGAAPNGDLVLLSEIAEIGHLEVLVDLINKGKGINILNASDIIYYFNHLKSLNNKFDDVISKLGGRNIQITFILLIAMLIMYYGYVSVNEIIKTQNQKSIKIENIKW